VLYEVIFIFVFTTPDDGFYLKPKHVA